MARRRTLSVLLAAVIFFLPFYAYAMNESYLVSEKWINNDNAITYKIDNTVVGSITYYYNSDDNELFTRISVNEKSINTDSNIIICFCFYCNGEIYSVSVDDDGLCEDDGSYNNMFDVKTVFNNGESSGEYVTGIELDNLLRDSSLRIMMSIDNELYLIAENVYLSNLAMTENETTSVQKNAVKTTTVKATTTKSVKETSSKSIEQTTKVYFTKPTTAKVSNTAKSSRKYAKTANTTVATQSSTKYIPEQTIEVSSMSQITPDEQQPSTEIGKGAKKTLFAGIAVSAIGLAIIATAIKISRKKGNDDISISDKEE